MIPLFAFLAGMAFVIALFGVVIALAEHYRADAAERALRVTLAHDNAAHSRENAARAADIAQLTRAHVEIWQSIHGLAEVSFPPTIPSGKVHIVVPGPRTAQ